MDVVSTAALARELRWLDDAELAAFVAGLWAARGFETTVRGATVLAERDGSDPVTIRCGGDRPTEPSQVDAVIVRARRPATPEHTDFRVIGSGELRQMLLYAVDREVADRLCRAHLGRPLAARASDVPLRARLPTRSTRPLLAMGLLAVLAVGVAFGVGGGLPFTDTDRSVASAAVPTAQGTPVPDVSTTAPDLVTDSGLPAAGGSLFRYPPGIDPSGVADADALAAAHRSAVANASWTLTIDHDRSHDLVHPYRVWTESRQTVMRVNATHYEFHVTGTERTGNDSLATVTYVDYGDGEYNYRRLIGLHGDAFRRTELPSEPEAGIFAAVSVAYVHRYLSTTESRVETIQSGATTRQRVVATGTPTAMARTVANYTAVAIVDRRGLVRSLTVEYTLRERVPDPIENGIATPYAAADRVPTESRGTVRFELQFRAVGETSLQPPGWYDAARNSTNDTDVAPWPTDPAV